MNGILWYPFFEFQEWNINFCVGIYVTVGSDWNLFRESCRVIFGNLMNIKKENLW